MRRHQAESTSAYKIDITVILYLILIVSVNYFYQARQNKVIVSICPKPDLLLEFTYLEIKYFY